jgi:putative redox protein
MKSARIRLLGDLRFRGVSGSGHAVHMDSADGDSGARPAELLLVALAGCTAMDVISILRKKRQAVLGYEVAVTGDQRPGHPAVFERIDVVHVLEGAIDEAAVRRAIELSATRYCAVSLTVASGLTQIHHSYELRRADKIERGEVCRTGPFQSIDVPLAATG